MKKATITQTITFPEALKKKGSMSMVVYHWKSQPTHLVTLNQVCAKYNAYLSEGTIRLYASTGRFVFPVAVMVTSTSLAWLYEADTVDDYFASRKSFDQKKYDEMVEKSRRLQARGARLRYKADKMKEKFIITTKEKK
jgi:hypothetical protein